MYRLDAAESVFFKRELESIDSKVYAKKYPDLLTRSLFPSISGLDETARVHTWRESDTVAKAKLIHDYADDMPAADVVGTEHSVIVKDYGASYHYTLGEIQAAAKYGKSLDAMKALAARSAVERKLDEVLSLGDSLVGLKGALNLANTLSFTPGTKGAGGLTWGTLAAPNATGEEVALDLMGIVAQIHASTKGLWSKFRIVLPIEQYNYAAGKRLGANSDVTALDFALKTSPFIESVKPWYRCDGAGGGGSDRMMAFPLDEEVLGAVVTREYMTIPPQERNFAMVVNGMASTAGFICRYPVAVAYGDGI